MKYKVKLKFKLFKSKIFKVIMFLFFIGVIISIPSIFASLQPVKSIEITSQKASFQDKESGAWKLTKSASFKTTNVAEVSLDFETIAKTNTTVNDIVFLIDTSESLIDSKLNILKSTLIEVINQIFLNEKNKVGLITFNGIATKISNLNNLKDEKISCINNITPGNGTSYYKALIELESLLNNYEVKDNRNLNVILITDGVPNQDTPNEVGQYNYLKDKFSFLNISGVQYNVGDKVLEELKNITDKQYLTNTDNFYETLINLVNNPIEYEKIAIKDYMDFNNFTVERIEDIKINYGSIKLENNLITWNLDKIDSGSKAKMTFKAKLKNTDNGVYQLNERIEVNSKIDNIIENINSPKTPVLANFYKVIYDDNAPKGCSVSGVPTEANHKVFDTIGIAPAPKCSGYQFKGWDIITENVEKMNNDYFKMPEENVTLKGNWSKINLKKSTDGKVSQGLTLYSQVAMDAKDNNFARKYTGNKSTFKGNKDVYYYYGEASNNNVVFANYCWKIVRTTDTGGVKLLYNGVPSSDGNCANSKEGSVLMKDQIGASSFAQAFNFDQQYLASVGYMSNIVHNWYSKNMSNLNTTFKNFDFRETFNKTITSGFYTGSNFEKVGGNYYPIGDKYSSSAIENRNPDFYKGKYFCPSYMNDYCNPMYYIFDVSNDYQFTALSSNLSFKISSSVTKNSNGSYSLNNPITMDFTTWVKNHQNYRNYYICENKNSTTCNNIYKIVETSLSGVNTILSVINDTKTMNFTMTPQNMGGFMTGTDYDFSVGQYYPSGDIHNSQDLYNRQPEYFVNKYYCPSYMNIYCNPIYYIVNATSSYDFTALSSDFSLKVASEVTKNSNGTYSLTAPITLSLKQWVNGYQYYRNYYFCKDKTSTTCNDIYKITNTSLQSIEYSLVDFTDYNIFGNSFTYSNGIYRLTNTKTVGNWANDYKKLNNYHYTCFNSSGECSSLKYVYYANNNTAYYVELTGGKNINDVLNDMLSNNNLNKNNSSIKDFIDYWYEHNMTGYTTYLEDTVFCNDRSISDKGGWNPDGGDLTSYLKFLSNGSTTDLTCRNSIDRFTVNAANGNGNLIYPVGLLTKPELALAYDTSKSPLTNNAFYWMMSPNFYEANYAHGFASNPSGVAEDHGMSGQRGIRPVISLRSNIEYSIGDGTVNNPYIIYLDN